MVADGSSDLQTRLDVTEQIKSFERKFHKLEQDLPRLFGLARRRRQLLATGAAFSGNSAMTRARAYVECVEFTKLGVWLRRWASR